MNNLQVWSLQRENPNLTKNLIFFRFYLQAFKSLTVHTPWTLNWSTWFNFTNRRLSGITSFTNQRYKVSTRGDDVYRKILVKPTYSLTSVRFSEKSTLLQIFHGFWEVSRPKSNHLSWTHQDFRLMFMRSHPQLATLNSAIINSERYFSRWVDSYNLMFNLFYTSPTSQLLTNKVFLEESLIFNWHYSTKNYKLFKYIQPFYSLKDSLHGEAIHGSVFAIFLQRLEFMVVADILNHRNLLKYMRRYGLYSIGLVPASHSPWEVSYPIPSVSDSLATQLFFLKWILLVSSRTRILKYDCYRAQ